MQQLNKTFENVSLVTDDLTIPNQKEWLKIYYPI